MNNNEHTECIDTEAQTACVHEQVPATLEEVKDAIKHLEGLLERYHGRAAFAAYYDEGDSIGRTFQSTKETFISDGVNSEGLGWMSACGYLLKASDSFSSDAETIGTGCKYFVETQSGISSKRKLPELSKLLESAMGR